MMSGRSILALAWLAVVGSVAGLTWLVVDTVGKDLGPTGSRVVYAAPRTAGSGSPAASPSFASPAPSATPSTSADGESDDDGEVVALNGATRPAGDQGTGVPANPPAPIPAPANPAPPAPAPQPPAPTVVTRQFVTVGGSVLASCQGSALSIGGSTPRNGYKVEQEVDGGRLKVKFEGGGSEIEFRLGCSGGAPALLSQQPAGAVTVR